VSWRDYMQSAIREGTYAKCAKVSTVEEGTDLLHLLHTDFPEPHKSGPSQEDPSQAAIGWASSVLNAAGVRIVLVDGGAKIGLWSDLDSPEIRAALRTLQIAGLAVCYLDGPGVPMRYKLRRSGGDPVPLSVLNEMEQQGDEPWKIRDQILKELVWRPRGIPWVEGRVAASNRLFQTQSVTAQPCRNRVGTALAI